MAVYIASYFLGPRPVLFTQMHWRDKNCATLVGEKTGGGAHMGRGLQRLSPLFTAFIPVGESINPITKTNWEGAGVQPDVTVPADKALQKAHLLALRKLLDRERDPAWRDTLLRTLTDVAGGK